MYEKGLEGRTLEYKRGPCMMDTCSVSNEHNEHNGAMNCDDEPPTEWLATMMRDPVCGK